MIVGMNQRNKEDNFMYKEKQDKVIYCITAHEHKSGVLVQSSAETMFKNADKIIYSGTKKKKKTDSIRAVFDYKYLDQ